MKGDLFWLNGLEEEIDDFEQIFEKTILRLSLWSRTQVSPISLFLGGISTQEIEKIQENIIYSPMGMVWF